jgi:hypothetical protein
MSRSSATAAAVVALGDHEGAEPVGAVAPFTRGTEPSASRLEQATHRRVEVRHTKLTEPVRGSPLRQDNCESCPIIVPPTLREVPCLPTQLGD